MKEIVSLEDLNTEIKNNQKLLVKFHAQWCGPCRALTQTIATDEIQNALKENNVAIIGVDVDNAHEIARHYNVMSLPTTMLFKNGQSLSFKIGNMNADQLLDLIDEIK